MVLIEINWPIVYISNKHKPIDNDYFIYGDENGVFNLQPFVPWLHFSSKWYFHVMVVTLRRSFQTTQTINQQFDLPGIYSLIGSIYDPLTQISYLSKDFTINGTQYEPFLSSIKK